MNKQDIISILNDFSNAYDLIYSASAFHWIPEEIGYTKVYKALKPGGVIRIYDTMDLQLARKVK